MSATLVPKLNSPPAATYSRSAYPERAAAPVGKELLVVSRQSESTPAPGALPNFNRSEPQAATLVGLTSRTLLELAIGIDRGFIASGISRTRSTCRSPFSRLAPLTLT